MVEWDDVSPAWDATDAATGETVRLTWTHAAAVGEGSFGKVLRVELCGDKPGTKGAVVAIKKTKQDRRYKNRELQVMQCLQHPNIVKLKYWFFESLVPGRDPSPEDPEVYLNLVLEYLPETIYRHYRAYAKRRQAYPDMWIKVFMFQLLRAVAFTHSHGIMHRDLKPHNILVDPETGRAVLIDFGSAKLLRRGEANVSYTCSRYYRACELIFGATDYTLAIDLWSVGCTFGELLLGRVLFPGSSSIEQLVEIFRVLGTPSKQDITAMHPSFLDHKFPQIEPVPLERLITKAPPEAVDLLSRFLAFHPAKRISAIEALAHPYFDALKTSPKPVLPNGADLPPDLFRWTKHELSIRPDLVRRLVPTHAEQQLYKETGIDLAHFEPCELDGLKVEIE